MILSKFLHFRLQSSDFKRNADSAVNIVILSTDCRAFEVFIRMPTAAFHLKKLTYSGYVPTLKVYPEAYVYIP